MTIFGKKDKTSSERHTSATDGSTSSDAHLNETDTAIPVEGENKDLKPVRYLPGGKFPTQNTKSLLAPLLSFLVLLIVNVGIPLALYYGLRNTIGIIWALIVSGAPSMLYVIYGIIRNRRLDVLGFVIGLSFILSGIISVVSGDERAALIRDSSVAAVIGVLFLLTLIPLRTKFLDNRPLTFKLGQEILANLNYSWVDRDGNPQEQHVMLWQWDHIRFFRISQYIQTAAWGLALILELIACVLMVEVSSLTVDQIVLYNNIINACVIAVMVSASFVLSYYNGRLEQKIGKEWSAENDFSEIYGNQQGHSQRTNEDIV